MKLESEVHYAVVDHRGETCLLTFTEYGGGYYIDIVGDTQGIKFRAKNCIEDLSYQEYKILSPDKYKCLRSLLLNTK